MRYYFDCEFIDSGKSVDLISIGIVCEDGRELYLVSNEFDAAACSDWVKENVLPQLPPKESATAPGAWRSRDEIAMAVETFIHPRHEPAEFWAYFASYDWLCLCSLYGSMMNLPKHFPRFVRDLKTFALDRGFTGKFKDLLPDTGHHDALADARWNRDVHNILLAQRTPAEALLAHILSARAAFSLDPGGPQTPLEGFIVIENWIRAFFARSR